MIRVALMSADAPGTVARGSHRARLLGRFRRAGLWLVTLAGGLALSFAAADAAAQGATRPASADDAPASVEPQEPFTVRPRALGPQSHREVTQPGNRPTLAWFLTQLVPSPGLWMGPAHDVDVRDVRNFDDPNDLPTDVPPGTRFFRHQGGIPRLSLAWQVTPILYSFGINRRVNPWRFLVVDPLARVYGSIELHFSPEWMPGAPDTNLFYRTGFRTTLPLHQHGEYVALMMGASYSRFEGRGGVVFEGGLSLLFGSIGLVVSHSPSFPDLRYGVRLNLKYF